MDHSSRPAGLVAGSLVAIAFGLVFVLVNSGGLAAGVATAVRIAGVVVAAGLLVWLFLRARRPAAGPDGAQRGFPDRRYWQIVGIEGLALFGGLVLINAVLDQPKVAVAWVALVVGVHFFWLARLWTMPLYTGLGVVMSLLGVAGFVLAAAGASAAAIGLVSGVLSGFALFATVAVALAR